MSTRFRIVLIATIFNLLFEFSFRGLMGLAIQKNFFIILFFLYFSYFSIIEDLIRRYRITNSQLLLAAFAFGMMPMTFLTGAIFTPPLILGVNWGVIFGVNIVWWGFTQGLLTFYLANRLVKRDWQEPLMSKFGRRLCWAYLILIHLAIFRSPTLVKGPGIGYLVVFIIFFLIMGYFRRRITKPQQEIYTFEKSLILDILTFGAIFIFIFCGLVLAKKATFDAKSNSVFNPISAKVSTNWTRVMFFGTIFYYIKNRRRITI